MKNKIRLDTLNDLRDFVNMATCLPDAHITVTDNHGMRVNGRSMLGMMYAMEFTEIWMESELDVYSAFERFIVID